MLIGNIDPVLLLTRTLGGLKEGVLLIDPTRRTILFANPAIKEIFGYSQEELVGQTTEVLHVSSETFKEWGRMSVLALEREGIFQSDFRMRRKDGSLFDTSHTILPILPQEGWRSGVINIIQDISEKSTSHQLIEQKESRYKRLFQNVPLPVFVFDWKTFRIEDVNQSAIDQYGYTYEEFLSMSVKDLRPPSEIPIFVQAISSLPTSTVKVGVWKHRRKDGSEFKAEVLSYLLDGAESNLRISVVTDVSEQAIYQEALEQALEVKAAILNALPGNIAVLDKEGFIVFVNDSWKKFARENDLEMENYGVGLNYLEVCHRSSVDQVDCREAEEGIRAVLTGKRPDFTFEYDCHSSDEKRWFQMMVRPISDRKTEGAVIMHINVTQRKLAENKTLEQYFVSTLQAKVGLALGTQEPLDVMLLKCCEAVVNHLDMAFARIWLLDRKSQTLELKASAGIYTHIDGGHRSVPVGELKIGRIAKSKVPHLTNRVIGDPQVKDQDWARSQGMVSFAGYPLILEEEVVGVLAMFGRHPLSDLVMDSLRAVGDEIALGIVRKQSDEERTRLTAAIEQISESALIADSQGTIIYVNPAFTRMTGYTFDEAVGGHPRILRSDNHTDEFYSGIWKTLLKGEVWLGRLTNRRKDGSLFQQETTITPIRYPLGDSVHYVEIGRDVTHEVEMEARMRQSEKMEAVGQLASGIAHDFNNLLQIIIAYATFVRKEFDMGDPACSDVDQIISAGEKAAALTKQLLSFSRQSEMMMGPLNLVPLVKEIFKLLERTVPKSIALQLDIINGSNLPEILADPYQIQQVLLNLCVNARDAMQDGGRLRIELSAEEVVSGFHNAQWGPPPGRYVRISVSDTGTGIEPAHLERIFEPFFTTKELGKGTGLGLATSYGIMKQHKGTIRCESQLGLGSTFYLCFPVYERDQNLNLPPSDLKEIPRGVERLLIVEDNEGVMMSHIKNFLFLGYEVLSAKDGLEALRLFEENMDRIDLVLTDAQMPKMTGVQLAENLLSLKPDTRIILATGYTDEDLIHNYREIGIRALLQKPISPSELAQTVRRVLDED